MTVLEWYREYCGIVYGSVTWGYVAGLLAGFISFVFCLYMFRHKIIDMLGHIYSGAKFKILFNHRHYDKYTGEYLGKKLIMCGWFHDVEES